MSRSGSSQGGVVLKKMRRLLGCVSLCFGFIDRVVRLSCGCRSCCSKGGVGCGNSFFLWKAAYKGVWYALNQDRCGLLLRGVGSPRVESFRALGPGLGWVQGVVLRSFARALLGVPRRRGRDSKEARINLKRP